MPEGIISAHDVQLTPDGRSVEVIATLDAGEVVPGMFVHIPLNGMLDFTVKVSAVASEAENRIRIVLDCGQETEGAEVVKAFNFKDETLWVLETGEPL
jgi:hypothetical protein